MRAPQLLEQRAVFALEPFLDRFVFGSFPEPLLDHVVGGHVVLPRAFRPALYAKPRFPLFRGVRGRWRRLQKDPVGSSG
jgi:hypothetical protein